MTGWLRNVFGADQAADAQRLATEQAVEGQQEALDYLREREAVPIAIRDEALQGLSGFYQVPGDFPTQDELIEEAYSSPLYRAIIGSREAGEEAILRNASATGGLRSGDTNRALSDYNMQLENRALLEAFNQSEQRADYERGLNLQGLTGLAGLTGNENAIASLTSGIGQTRAQGTIGQAQTQTDALNNAFDTILGIGQIAAPVFSDIRLKENIEFIGNRDGFKWYRWDWNKEAESLGYEGWSVGVMAHQINEQYPEAVGEKEGYLVIDYNLLNKERIAA